MRISDWSSDVCSSDLVVPGRGPVLAVGPVDRIGIGVEQVAKRQPVFERSLKRHGSPLFAQLRRWSSLPPVCLQPMGGRTAVIASGEGPPRAGRITRPKGQVAPAGRRA